jgi:hypothetical protein
LVIVCLRPPAVIPQPTEYATKTFEVEEAYERGKFVVQTEYPFRKFMVFNDYIEFFHYSRSLPEEQRCFHEVIIGDGPRNLYVDIDGSNIPEAEYPTFGAEIVRTFINCISSYWGKVITYDEVMAVSACGFSATKGHSKFSAHIRLHNLARNAGVCKVLFAPLI